MRVLVVMDLRAVSSVGAQAQVFTQPHEGRQDVTSSTRGSGRQQQHGTENITNVKLYSRRGYESDYDPDSVDEDCRRIHTMATFAVHRPIRCLCRHDKFSSSWLLLAYNTLNAQFATNFSRSTHGIWSDFDNSEAIGGLMFTLWTLEYFFDVVCARSVFSEQNAKFYLIAIFMVVLVVCGKMFGFGYVR